MLLKSRTTSLLGAFVCHELLVAAYYFQYVEGLEPCNLCIFQRILVFALGLVWLLQGLHNPQTTSWANRIYSSLAALVSVAGVYITGKHVYLQSLPEGDVPACAPPLDYLVDVMPNYFEVISEVLSASGDCAKVTWRFLGLSMPTWVLLFFIVALLVTGVRLVSAWRKQLPSQ